MINLVEDVNNSDMTISEFLTAVKEVYAKYFPDSVCGAKFSSSVTPSIFINCYLAGNQSELSGGYAVNDLFHCSLCIFIKDRKATKDSLFGEQTLEMANGSSILTKPDNKYCVYGSVKVPFRKTTGDAKKLLNYFDKYVRKIRDVLKEQLAADNIPNDYVDLVKQKLGV